MWDLYRQDPFVPKLCHGSQIELYLETWGRPDVFQFNESMVSNTSFLLKSDLQYQFNYYKLKNLHASNKQVVFIGQTKAIGTCGDCGKLKTTWPVQQYSNAFKK